MKTKPPITERELVVPTLKVLLENGGYISTSALIHILSEKFRPAGVDAEILRNRNDNHFSQKVRNLVSHRQQSTNFIAAGYAKYVPGGLYLTDKGRKLLAMIPANDA